MSNLYHFTKINLFFEAENLALNTSEPSEKISHNSALSEGILYGALHSGTPSFPLIPPVNPLLVFSPTTEATNSFPVQMRKKPEAFCPHQKNQEDE